MEVPQEIKSIYESNGSYLAFFQSDNLIHNEGVQKTLMLNLKIPFKSFNKTYKRKIYFENGPSMKADPYKNSGINNEWEQNSFISLNPKKYPNLQVEKQVPLDVLRVYTTIHKDNKEIFNLQKSKIDNGENAIIKIRDTLYDELPQEVKNNNALYNSKI